ncbi:MAG TPA: MarC family protein [Terracidiphilus sp.]|jgi:multiple antibiotic resistance protein
MQLQNMQLNVMNSLLVVLNSFLIAFSALLPLINPLGSALVFNGLVGDAPSPLYRSLARRIAINNIVFLTVIELLGVTILNFFGISLPIVQFSGGMVIAAMGWSVLNERDARATSRMKKQETDTNDDREFQEHHFEQEIFYPFTFPITSGPGTLVALLTVVAHNSSHTLTKNVLSHAGVFLAIVVLSLLVYFCYGYSPKLTKAIPPSTAHGILRVVAFILLCIGVQISWNGLAQLIDQVIHGHHG